MGSRPVAATWISEIASVLRKGFLDNHAITEPRFTLRAYMWDIKNTKITNNNLRFI